MIKVLYYVAWIAISWFTFDLRNFLPIIIENYAEKRVKIAHHAFAYQRNISWRILGFLSLENCNTILPKRKIIILFADFFFQD